VVFIETCIESSYPDNAIQLLVNSLHIIGAPGVVSAGFSHIQLKPVALPVDFVDPRIGADPQNSTFIVQQSSDFIAKQSVVVVGIKLMINELPGFFVKSRKSAVVCADPEDAGVF